MAKQKGKSLDDGVLKFLLTGGVRMPADLKAQRLAAAQDGIRQRAARDGFAQRGAKLWGTLQEPSRPSRDDPADAKALDGLLAMHKKLAATKVVAPRVAAEVGGLFPGMISVKETPPFDYAMTIPTVIEGSPVISGAANTNGQLNGSAVTNMTGRSAGSWYSEMGLFFHPLSAGRLRLSSSPSMSFQFWTNSLKPQHFVRSFGHAGLGVFTLDRVGNVGTVNAGPAHLKLWDEQATQQIRFDFGSIESTPLSLEFDVNPTLIYCLFVSLSVHAIGRGWPGSLAGSVISVVVPSFSWDFWIEPVLEQF